MSDERGQGRLVSMLMLTFNQEEFVAEAVRSVLAQDYSPLEILISDDCSSDGTLATIEQELRLYEGPHRVTVRRNAANLGLAEHFSQVARLCRGEVVVVAAGDDVSLPDRVSRSLAILNSYPEASFVSFTDICIDRFGQIVGGDNSAAHEHLTSISLDDFLSGKHPSMSGASRAYRRCIFEFFPTLNSDCPTEDTPHILRGLMLGGGVVSARPGIKYRVHRANLSRVESLVRMPIEQIRNQYLCDTEFAANAGYIDRRVATRILGWAESTYIKRSTERKIYFSSFPLLELCKAMMGRTLTFRQRLSLIAGFIRQYDRSGKV